jgi:glycosyltransferase involved in cell wall biosynthesis
MSTIGIALCTYNGERYLREQLESYLSQTRVPDLLLACDDGSQDGTVRELEAIAARAPFPVRVVRNSANLGFRRNFEQAIARCNTDVVVLSDQDDWWRRDKLQKVEAVFRADPAAVAVFSDAELVDEQMRPLGSTLLEALSLKEDERSLSLAGRLFPVLLRRNIACGATMAFRSDWKERFLPIAEGAVHDEWIALVAAAHSGLRALPEPLIRYRQHGTNEIGLRSRQLPERMRNLRRPQRPELQRLLAVLEALDGRLAATRAPAEALGEVRAKIEHVQRRLELPQSRLGRLPAVIAEWKADRYARFAAGWRTALRDLVVPM